MTVATRLVRRRSVVLLPLAASAWAGLSMTGLGMAGLGLTALTGCQEPPAPPPDFTPLKFDYLPKLKLNVATIDIDNAWQPATVPDGAHVEYLAPMQPLDALKKMAQDRLVPVGASGHAVLVIEDASLVQRAGQYEGTFQVHLDVSTSDGAHSGYAKASVSATRTIVEDSPAAARAGLYDLVKRMMADMNAEFEFQIRKTLHEYLQTGTDTAPAAAPVQTQDLPGAAAKPAQ